MTAARPPRSIPATPRRCWPRPTAAAGASARCGTPTGTPITPAATRRWSPPPAPRLSAPAAEAAKIAAIDVPLKEGDTIRLGDHVGEVWEVPGHTLGHIALIFRDAGVAFVGDTMFAMGCGRLFEGTPEQMHNSLQRLAALPPETLVYCAHEYTLANARFAAHIFPGDAAIADRLALVAAQRDAGQATVPTSIALERATNPFLRAEPPRNSRHFAAPRISLLTRGDRRCCSDAMHSLSMMSRCSHPAPPHDRSAERAAASEARLAERACRQGRRAAGQLPAVLPQQGDMEVIDSDTFLFHEGRTVYRQDTRGDCYPTGSRSNYALVTHIATPAAFAAATSPARSTSPAVSPAAAAR